MWTRNVFSIMLIFLNNLGLPPTDNKSAETVMVTKYSLKKSNLRIVKFNQVETLKMKDSYVWKGFAIKYRHAYNYLIILSQLFDSLKSWSNNKGYFFYRIMMMLQNGSKTKLVIIVVKKLCKFMHLHIPTCMYPWFYTCFLY